MATRAFTSLLLSIALALKFVPLLSFTWCISNGLTRASVSAGGMQSIGFNGILGYNNGDVGGLGGIGGDCVKSHVDGGGTCVSEPSGLAPKFCSISASCGTVDKNADGEVTLVVKGSCSATAAIFVASLSGSEDLLMFGVFQDGVCRSANKSATPWLSESNPSFFAIVLFGARLESVLISSILGGGGGKCGGL